MKRFLYLLAAKLLLVCNCLRKSKVCPFARIRRRILECFCDGVKVLYVSTLNAKAVLQPHEEHAFFLTSCLSPQTLQHL